MKKTFHVDEELLQQAKAACGARTDTETIRQGLEALVRDRAYRRIREYLGSEPNALQTETARRRERSRPRKPGGKREVE